MSTLWGSKCEFFWELLFEILLIYYFLFCEARQPAHRFLLWLYCYGISESKAEQGGLQSKVRLREDKRPQDWESPGQSLSVRADREEEEVVVGGRERGKGWRSGARRWKPSWNLCGMQRMMGFFLLGGWELLHCWALTSTHTHTHTHTHTQRTESSITITLSTSHKLSPLPLFSLSLTHSLCSLSITHTHTHTHTQRTESSITITLLPHTNSLNLSPLPLILSLAHSLHSLCLSLSLSLSHTHTHKQHTKNWKALSPSHSLPHTNSLNLSPLPLILSLKHTHKHTQVFLFNYWHSWPCRLSENKTVLKCAFTLSLV